MTSFPRDALPLSKDPELYLGDKHGDHRAEHRTNTPWGYSRSRAVPEGHGENDRLTGRGDHMRETS